MGGRAVGMGGRGGYALNFRFFESSAPCSSDGMHRNLQEIYRKSIFKKQNAVLGPGRGLDG